MDSSSNLGSRYDTWMMQSLPARRNDQISGSVKIVPTFLRSKKNRCYMDFQWNFLEISDFPKKYFRKMSKIFFLKNKFRSQKIKIFLWNFKLSHPMSRPSSSCIFGSIGPVEVFERGSYIVGILLCFLKKVGHTLLSRIM